MYALLRMSACVATILLFGSCKNLERPVGPIAVNGSLDLSTYYFTDQWTPLSGAWEFFPGQYIQKGEPSNDHPEYIKVGNVWNDRFKDGTGFASYRLRLKLPPGSYALHVPDAGTAYSLYCNGQIIATGGTIGQNATEEKPRLLVQTVPLCPGTEIELIQQVSNFHSRWGGFWFPLELGNAQEVQAKARRLVARDFVLMGGMALIGLYHLALFLIRPNDRSTLYFFFYCFCISLRAGLIGERVLIQIFPELPWDIAYRMEIASIYCAVGIPMFYLRSLFPGTVGRFAFLFYTIGGFSLAAVVAVTPN
ncbi:MAG: 7TM-DISM domain-containing protein, partial [Spirochaetia bacterium]|nr:7TM-DISM domain-containing protein [Spirochaetia bacterium]